MDKLGEISHHRKQAHVKFLLLKSKVYEAFLQVEKTAFEEGALSRKTKELIALGVSVRINCESCMQWHIEHAARSGASLREVLEAVEVAIEMGGGPTLVAARFALDVIESVFGPISE